VPRKDIELEVGDECTVLLSFIDCQDSRYEPKSLVLKFYDIYVDAQISRVIWSSQEMK
jgi:hypothetical protein